MKDSIIKYFYQYVFWSLLLVCNKSNALIVNKTYIKNNILQKIKITYSTLISKIDNDDINKITWKGGTTPISKSDIEAKEAELQTAYDNNKYQRDRAVEYPSIKDQLDDIYHNGIDGWKATIKVTKDKYPKE